MATMGANQFDKPEDQGIFFNWYFFAVYVTALISATAIVYIEDSVSWGLGFGLCCCYHNLVSHVLAWKTFLFS